MLIEKVRASRKEPTEQDLQDIAKAMYGELLGSLCTDQRAHPAHTEFHSAANLAFADYFERLTKLGGHCSFLPAEATRLRKEGWTEQRITDLETIIRLREDKGVSPIDNNRIDTQLAERGFLPDDRLRWMAQLALYPAYRDAYLDAELSLRGIVPEEEPVILRTHAQGSDQQVADEVLETPEADPIQDEWRLLSPTEVAERFISATPRMFEHRNTGKRAKEQVGEQTVRQIRWAATLLEKSLPPATPMWMVTREHIVQLDSHFDRLPVTFGKSPSDRDPTVTLDRAIELALDRLDSGDLDSEQLGLQVGTTNKHYNKLGQIHAYFCKEAKGATPIDFGAFTSPINKNEMEARKRYTVEQGTAIFKLAPWTGNAGLEGLKDRLKSGRQVHHDGLFFVLLLVWYTGARREELCKLLVSDIKEEKGLHYLSIAPTSTGRVKNMSAVRYIPIADELVRLGFVRYVEAMRAEGETILFPEIMPGGGQNRKFGDVFYKIWWIYIKPLVPDLQRGQAMHSARHMVSSELKDQQVFSENRNDLLGHKGHGEGETRYPSRSALERLKQLVDQIPKVTGHLPEQLEINLLPAWQRKPRPTRG